MGTVESKTTRVETYLEESSFALEFSYTSSSLITFSQDSCDESSDDESEASSDNEDEKKLEGLFGIADILDDQLRILFDSHALQESIDKSSDDESDPSSDNEDENVTLYHYTNDNGAQGISKDKMIKASTDKNNDAVFGEGVYLTAMDPYTYSKEEIIRNNYDDGLSVHKSTRFHDKADSAIEVSIPVSEVSKVDNTDRDVYLYDGHLNLDEYDHSVLKIN